MIGFLMLLVITFAIFLGVLFLKKDKDQVTLLTTEEKPTGNDPYRTPEKPIHENQTIVEISGKPITRPKGPPAEVISSNLAMPKEPIMLSGGTEWFDQNAIIEQFEPEDKTLRELLLCTRKKTWVHKIGNSYFKVSENAAMDWLLKHQPNEFQKRGGWDKAKEV